MSKRRKGEGEREEIQEGREKKVCEREREGGSKGKK